jgi:hypothetical protein
MFASTMVLNQVFAVQSSIVNISAGNPSTFFSCSNLATVLCSTMQKCTMSVDFINQGVEFKADKGLSSTVKSVNRNNKEIFNAIITDTVNSRSGIGITGSTSTAGLYNIIDINAQGTRKGITAGMFKVSLTFLNYWERFLGISIEKFKNEETGRFSKIITASKKECFNKSLEILKTFKARVTHKNFKKGYITAFDFSKSFHDYCLDSTEVCIFIAEIESDKINVEVVSNNSLLANEFSVKLFHMLA